MNGIAKSLLLILIHVVDIVYTDHVDSIFNAPGHMKPFGFAEIHHSVTEVNGFPFTRHFFDNYVKNLEPVLMLGAAKLSRAYSKWTDDYFLSADEASENRVLIETKKKQNRTEPAVHMSFKDFIGVYKTNDQYMVDQIPHFIANDVMLPVPLQCQPIREGTLVDSVMWFSSGGTKSLVHTDPFDNINCLFRGEKEFILVDPKKYGKKVPLDDVEGTFSTIDVDRVDFTKYPGMAEVEYYHVHMNEGDCFYIPYKWIHQVTSHQTNIAVNLWWDHYLGLDVDLDQCPDVINPDITMDKVQLVDSDALTYNIDSIRDDFLDYTRRIPMSFISFLHKFIPDLEEIDKLDPNKYYQLPLRKIFWILDKNSNDILIEDEVLGTSDQDWEKVADHMMEFDVVINAVESQLEPEQVETDSEGGQDHSEVFKPRNEL